MSVSPSRRKLLAGAAAAGALSFLDGLPVLSAADVERPNMVAVEPDVESLVRLIETTQRDRLLEAVGPRIRDGRTSYQQLLAALMLAGVRNVKPRPVGFQFHAVLVINSAHLASIAAQDRDRWLPLFWALDYFKGSQATSRRQHNGWVMPPADENRLPAAHQARQRFVEAMDTWNVEAADPAAAQLARTGGAADVFELLWRYGARDFRDIGHKAIFVANAWRTLQTIGWRHSEPVLRSLALALLDHEGTSPAERDAAADRPWRDNVQRLGRFRQGWQTGRRNEQTAPEVLAAVRSGSPADCSQLVVQVINREVHPACVWDGLFLASGELLMRQPGIVGLHCVTTVNALHFAYQTSGNDETRRMMMMQAAAFLAMFREVMRGRGQVSDGRLDMLQAADSVPRGREGVEAILADVRRNSADAARKALAWLGAGGDPEALLADARRLVFLKGRDSHDYKFSSAALEDCYNTSGRWRNHFLASAMFNLRGSTEADSPLVARTRAALG